MLLCYQLQIIEDNSTFSGKNKKLIPNLDDKRKYKFNYQDMKLYLKLGSQLKIIKQKAILKPYIKCNAELQRKREKGGNKLKKPNAKLRNYSIFGKSIEDPFNTVIVKTVTTGVNI